MFGFSETVTTMAVFATTLESMNPKSILICVFAILAGCATQSSQQQADSAAALNAVLNAATEYASGNKIGAATNGIHGAAFLVRSLQGTPQAAQPPAVAAQAMTGGASPKLADTVAAATAVLVHAGKTPDAANEDVAKALDTATAK